MPAMIDADLGYLCARRRGDVHRELPGEHCRSRLFPAYSTRRSGCGIGHSDNGGIMCQDKRGPRVTEVERLGSDLYCGSGFEAEFRSGRGPGSSAPAERAARVLPGPVLIPARAVDQPPLRDGGRRRRGRRHGGPPAAGGVLVSRG